MSDNDFKAAKDVFTCNRCFNVVDTITNQLEERISKLFDSKLLLHSSIKPLTRIASTQTDIDTDTHTDTKTHTNTSQITDNVINLNITNEILPEKLSNVKNIDTGNNTQTDIDTDIHADTKTHTNTSQITDTVINSKVTNEILPEKLSNVKTIDTGNNITINTLNSVKDIEGNLGENSELPPNQEKPVDKCKIYMCGIETSLSIKDIKIILEDYSIHINKISFSEQEGIFKKKKYILISSNENVDFFKFKTSLLNSPLKNTWFLRDMPPKRIIPADKNSIPNKISINYKDLQRDKILLQNMPFEKKVPIHKNTTNHAMTYATIVKHQNTLKNQKPAPIHKNKQFGFLQPVNSVQNKQKQIRFLYQTPFPKYPT